MEKGTAELERAIEANPNDTDAYSVLADWLQAQGEPRGELIALQLAGKTAQADALIEARRDYFLGPLAEHVTTYDHAEEPAFTWKYGFIHAAKLTHDSYAKQLDSLANVLAQLLEHPSGRFLVELSFGFNGDPNEGTLQSLIDVLAGKPRPTIRKLHFGDYKFAGGHAVQSEGLAGEDTEISWYSVGNLAAVWAAVPRLETLIVQGGSAESAIASGMQLGTLALPNLRMLKVRSGGLDVTSARAAMAVSAPLLEHLEIWFGSPDYGGDTTVEDVEPLLARTDLPRLRHLGLRNAAFSDSLPERLAHSPLVRQIASLDLSLGTLTDDGAAELAEYKDAFAHLEVLDVTHSYLSSEGISALQGVAKRIVIGEQREDEDPDHRYTAVSE